MSERFHSGLHPDADSLSAFAEGVLPEHERLDCLAHLAECSRCRDIVYLAQNAFAEDPVPNLVADPAPFWKRWFAPLPVLAAAVAAVLIFFSVGIYRMIRSAEPRPPVTTQVARSAETAQPPQPLTQPSTTQSVTPKTAQHPSAKTRPAPKAAASPTAQSTAGVNVAPASPPPLAPAPAPAAQPNALTALNSAPSGASAVTGTITDPAGAIVPNAQIELKDMATGKAYPSIADTFGQFSIAGLTPGRYELDVTSPGFKKNVRQFDLPPLQTARLDTPLEVGATSETVTVNAESPLLKTESGAVAHVVSSQAATLPLFSARSVPAGITGAITDPSGAIVPTASVTLRQLAGGSVRSARVDAHGQFRFDGLTPGRYEVEITAPGFARASKQIDLQPQQIARADTVLPVGAASETITVTGTATVLQTESAEVSVSKAKPRASSAGPRPLPGKLPAVTTASKDKLMLAADSAGSLFFSRNAGKSWKVVKARWPGKVVSVGLANDSNGVFTLTTDAGSTWLSRDGTHWYAAPSPL